MKVRLTGDTNITSIDISSFEEQMITSIASAADIPEEILMVKIPWGYSVQSEWNHRFVMYFIKWLDVFDRYRRGELEPWERLDIRQIER